MKGIENITVGVVSLFLSASLCAESVKTYMIKCINNITTLVIKFAFISCHKNGDIVLTRNPTETQ